MKLDEFIAKHCRDIVAEYGSKSSSIMDSFDLPYDDEIEDDSGELMKVIYCGTTYIPIGDILTTTREDFARMYPDFECRELRDKYVDSLIMLEGEDAIKHIRNAMARERERIKAFAAADSDPELDNFL